MYSMPCEGRNVARLPAQGHLAHINHTLDLRLLQDCQQVLDRPSLIADCRKDGLWSSSHVFSITLTALLSNRLRAGYVSLWVLRFSVRGGAHCHDTISS
jgi:hypothetical protein